MLTEEQVDRLADDMYCVAARMPFSVDEHIYDEHLFLEMLRPFGLSKLKWHQDDKWDSPYHYGYGYDAALKLAKEKLLDQRRFIETGACTIATDSQWEFICNERRRSKLAYAEWPTFPSSALPAPPDSAPAAPPEAAPPQPA